MIAVAALRALKGGMFAGGETFLETGGVGGGLGIAIVVLLQIAFRGSNNGVAMRVDGDDVVEGNR